MKGDSDRSQALDPGEIVGSPLRVGTDALLDPVVLLEAVTDSGGRVVDFLYRELNQATCDYLGLSREELLGRGLLEMSPGVVQVGLFDDYVRCVETGQQVIRNDFSYDNEIIADTRRYDLRATRATATAISLTWRDVTDRFREAQLLAEARDLQHQADILYRRLVDNSAIATGLLTADGQFTVVNQAMCDFFGYDVHTLCTKTWQELTAPEFLEADLKYVDEVLAGHIESYRLNKQYLHADGHPIWGDLSVSCVRRPDGTVENLVVQIVDITAETEARRKLAASEEQKRLLTKRLQAETDRLAAELRSAARYVASILPGDLEGRVQVSSSYLPSQELAGDSFDYRWIDEDHLIVYLIDVSGHGIGPALLSVSVHNMLRSGSLRPTTLTAPEKVLTELNRRFQMDDHDDRYLTMWFGVYQASSRTLRYASAGAPPALVIRPDDPGTATELSTDGQPLGMFDDAAYVSDSYTVPPGCRILLYSDGAYEDAQIDGHPMSKAYFKQLFTRQSESPVDLASSLRSLTPSGNFQDDCSLVLLKFD